MRYCSFKRIIFTIIILIMSMQIVCADDKEYIDRIDILTEETVIASHPPAIGDYPETFRTKVYLSDGTIATADEYRDMIWKIERYDNVNKTYTTVATGEGQTMSFWQPYGTEPGQFYVTARAKIDPDAMGYMWYHLNYPWFTETFCIFHPGKVKERKIMTGNGDEANPYFNGIKAKDIKETYNWDTKEYTCIMPECPYRVEDYTFAGWKRGDVVYKTGDVFIANKSISNAYFEAQWKPNFKKPDVVANRVGNKEIKLSWNRMIGGKGYKIYRSTKKNGKYKLVKTVKNKLTTSWTDKSVNPGETYYYKVVAYKKSKQHKSAWVQISTKAAKVKSVKLNQGSLTGAVGGNAKLKAKVKAKAGSGKVLSKKVRWYSSNKNVAKVNEKTGEVTFVAAGNCQVWAKAHNGKNSEKIKVIVTAP